VSGEVGRQPSLASRATARQALEAEFLPHRAGSDVAIFDRFSIGLDDSFQKSCGMVRA